MTNCLCETCPLGNPNINYAAVHCLHRFTAYASDPVIGIESRTLQADVMPAWQSSPSMPHLFTRLAA